MENNPIKNKNLEELTTIEIYEIIFNALDKATLKGVYNMNEVFILKVLIDKLKNNI